MGVSDREPVAEEPIRSVILGYGVFEKAAKLYAPSARIPASKSLVGKRVIMGCL